MRRPAAQSERTLVWCRVREGSSSMEAALKVKSEQLTETEELLRTSREECSAMEAELADEGASIHRKAEDGCEGTGKGCGGSGKSGALGGDGCGHKEGPGGE